MAARLSSMASKIKGRNRVVNRSGSVTSSLRHRADMGLPVGKHTVPDRPLPVNDEFVRDNGTPLSEPRIERIADTVGKYVTLAWLSGGLSSLIGWAYWPGATTSPPGFRLA